MKLTQVIENSEWENLPIVDVSDLEKKVKALDHQSDVMLRKFERWAKLAPGKVFTVTGPKTGLPLPKQVSANPSAFLGWTLVHSNNTNLATKVYVHKEDPEIVLPIRALINRHNEVTNIRAIMDGRLIKARNEAAKKK